MSIKIEDMDRPVRKTVEHLLDAKFHIMQSKLSDETKNKVDALLTDALVALAHTLDSKVFS